MPEFEGRQGIFGDENLFNRYGLRRVVDDDPDEFVVDDFQSVGEIIFAVGKDRAVVDMQQAIPLLFDDAVAGNPAPRVNPQNAHGFQSEGG